jgi:hypothetical protein
MLMEYQRESLGAMPLAPAIGRIQYALAPRRDTDPDVLRLLRRYAPINLDQMDAVALQDRTDTKYVLSAQHLYAALASLAQFYWVLDIDGVRLHPYQTVYFDTADFALYMRHHDGRRNRCKVRSRQYIETNQAFFEVKLKTGDDRTQKKRIATPDLVTRLDAETSAFLQDQVALDSHHLEPRLWNGFSRITLVSKQFSERLTLDLHLRFSHDRGTVALPGLVIAEVKQDGLNRHSRFVEQMRALRVRPTSFSKYCMGVSMLYPHVKHNTFKPKLRLVHALLGGTSYGQHTY